MLKDLSLCSVLALVFVINTICSHAEYSLAAVALPKMGLTVDYKLVTAQALKPNHSAQRNFALGWVFEAKETGVL